MCNPYGGELSYEAYLTHLLTEVGYVLIYLSPFEKMLEFIHEEDSKMKVLLTLEEDLDGIISSYTAQSNGV